MYDYLLTLSDEVGPKTQPKIPQELTAGLGEIHLAGPENLE